jgi:hypothetical protein
LNDGLYSIDTSGGPLILPKGTVIQSADGARPTLIGSDGFPPAIDIQSGAIVRGIWFGGTHPSDSLGKTITMGSGCLVEDCTLFGYTNGIQNGSGAMGNVYRRNRFVKCGYQDLWHPIYIANLNSAGSADGCLVELNIMVGCEGYSIQLYHQPSYGVAKNNFMGDCRNGLAIQGDQGGPVSGPHNIIWGASQWPLYFSVTTGNIDGNVWQGCTQPLIGGDGSMDHNHFVGTVPTAGTNPSVWQESDVLANFRQSSSDIDAAIAALEASFTADVTTIHADATIEPNFALLAGVIQMWAAQP